MADLLPEDLWCFIGCKLDSTGDRIRFRAVSKSLKSALPFRQPPWLMLAEYLPSFPVDEEEPSWMTVLDPEFKANAIHPRGFASVGEQTQSVCTIDFPEVHQARVVGSTAGWLITMHLDKTMRLSNPFGGLKQQFHLPSFTTFRYGGLSRPNLFSDVEVYYPTNRPPETCRDGLVWKVVLSSSPAPNTTDCVALAMHFQWKILAISRPGDASWTTLQVVDAPPKTVIAIEDMVFYKQHFYAITHHGRLMVCDLIGNRPLPLNPPLVRYLSASFFPTNDPWRIHCLVESAGDLLMVTKLIDDLDEMPTYRTHAIQLYKFDFANNQFQELSSLGDRSLLLGFNTSVSVLGSDYFGLVKKNCIYFTDDYSLGYVGEGIPGGHDMGVFHLDDATITPHFQGTSTSLYSPPVWILQP